jgi:hypothetical protein
MLGRVFVITVSLNCASRHDEHAYSRFGRGRNPPSKSGRWYSRSITAVLAVDDFYAINMERPMGGRGGDSGRVGRS